MFTHTKDQQARIDNLGCTYRIVRKSFTPTKEDPYADKKNGLYCDIIDMQTGLVYAEGRGDTEPEALTEALRAAMRAPKPSTRAQRAEPQELQERLAKVRKDYFEDHPELAEDVESSADADVEPSDRNTKAWKEWDKRQKAKKKE